MNTKISLIPPQGRVETTKDDTIFFIDFEFDNFKSKTPLSVGLCSLDGKHNFYREFKADYSNQNDWVKENVIAHFEGGAKSEDEIKNDLSDFLSPFSNIFILSDHPVDLEILCKLNPRLTDPIRILLFQTYVMSFIDFPIMATPDIKEKFERFKTIVSNMEQYEQYFKDNGIIQHHALNDTKVMATLLQKGFENERKRNQS